MSVIMRNPQQFKSDTTNLLYENLQNCNCCPYGYHIDLDFVRYCETLVGDEKPSAGQLLRRDKRRSRKSIEIMLGLDSFYFWEPNDRVQTVKEVQIEAEPESPRVVDKIQNYSSSIQCYDSSSSTMTTMTTITTLASTPITPTTTNNSSSPAETKAFLHDALDDVVNDFERTLERTSKKKNKIYNIPWEQYIDVFDSCVSGNKSANQTIRKDVAVSPIQRQQPTQQQQQQPSQHHHQQQQQQPEKEDSESIGSNGSTELDTQTLQNIREQMAKSLNRMKELEEQVKKIPILQKQLNSLKEEKRQLELQLKREEATTKNLLNHVTSTATANNIAAIKPIASPFTPQKISPIALESLGTHIGRQDNGKKIIKRDVAVMCTQHTRDASTVTLTPAVMRSTGTNPLNTQSIKDHLYTSYEVEELIKGSLREYEDRKRAMKQRNSISVGTQMAPQPKPHVKHAYIQTINPIEKLVPKISQGVMAVPFKKDAFMTARPETRSVGCSDDKLTNPICDKCLMPKRTVACGPDNEDSKNYLSLKQMDMPPRSLSFSLGEYEKLNIRRKTVGTQYHRSVQNVGIQNTVPMQSIAVQSSIIHATKSCQHSAEGISKHTDTEDLILLIHKNINTDENKSTTVQPKSTTIDKHCNTDKIRTRDHGTITVPLSSKLKNSSSNTDKIVKKDVGCGDIIKPHISISCADNYCDSCKDAIKNLAREFSSTKLLLPANSNTAIATTTNHSNNNNSSHAINNGNGTTKIPRPTTLTSPRSTRKLFLRQNTYTIPTPSPSPIVERKIIGAVSHQDTTTKRLSGSLDSVNLSSLLATDSKESTVRTAPNKTKDGELLSRSYHEEVTTTATVATATITTSATAIPSASSKHEDGSVNKTITQGDDKGNKSKNDVESGASKTVITSDIATAAAAIGEIQESQKPQTSSSHHLQHMLLNQLATSTSEPRTKTTPSKEMKAAMKVINDSLQKSGSKTANLKNANAIVQKEWFKISSTDKANPMDVEDYLDCFEEYSNALLKYIVNMMDSNGNTAMHYAVSHGNFDIVSILLDSKVCNVNQTNNAGYTCVMLVSLAKLKNSAHRTVVQRLFQMADVNIRAKKHCQTALMLAVSHGNLDMVEMLLNAGADINIQDEDGSTALMCAAEHGRIDIVKHLLSQPDCDSLIQDVDGTTAFKIAWQAEHRDIGLLLYVHEQMLRSKMPNLKTERSPATPRHQKAYQMHQQQQQQQQQSKRKD